MKVLFLDVETTGLDHKSDRVVEIGASLYCTIQHRVLKSICFLTADDTVKITAEISSINKITQKMLERDAVTYNSILKTLTEAFVESADYLCAHNATFDKSFLESELERAKLPKWEKPWLDTLTDIPYPESITTRKLTHLAAEHNFLNPFPHTAMSDVLTTQKIFSHYKIDDIVKRSKTPNVIIWALVDYASRDKAKKFSFRYEPTSKRWYKKMKQDEFEKEKSKYDFNIKIEEEIK